MRKLTTRQKQVLRLIAKGLTNQEIAERLNISSQTVKNHVTFILVKLGASNRTHAAILFKTKRV